MTLKVLSYNVWFDDVKIAERMKAIVGLVKRHRPAVVMLQEVTAQIQGVLGPLMHQCGYETPCSIDGRRYGELLFVDAAQLRVERSACVPFDSSSMGRELQIVVVRKVVAVVAADSNADLAPTNSAPAPVTTVATVAEVCDAAGGAASPAPPDGAAAQGSFVLATAHLESLAANKVERKRQLLATWDTLQALRLPFVFGGDTNLGTTEQYELPHAIVDAWQHLGQAPAERDTWDTSVNHNLDASFTARCRLDRFFCSAGSVTPTSFQLVGKERIDAKYYPSDHWGILGTFEVRT